MSLVSHKKSYLVCAELWNWQIYECFYFQAAVSSLCWLSQFCTMKKNQEYPKICKFNTYQLAFLMRNQGLRIPKQSNPVQSIQGSSKRCSTVSPCNKQDNSCLQSEAFTVSASSNIETPTDNPSDADTTRHPSPSIHWKSNPSRNGSAEPLVMPEEMYAAQYSKAWVRLTALARGYLVRKLLATEKVQFLKRTIRETLACAVRLHLEIGIFCFNF